MKQLGTPLALGSLLPIIKFDLAETIPYIRSWSHGFSFLGFILFLSILGVLLLLLVLVFVFLYHFNNLILINLTSNSFIGVPI
jgi:hypothetical protein